MINERELTLTEILDKISGRLKDAENQRDHYRLKRDTEYEYWEGSARALNWVQGMLLSLMNNVGSDN